MIAKLNPKHAYDKRAATNSRRSAVVTLQKPTQAGYTNYFLRQIGLFPLSATRLLERQFIAEVFLGQAGSQLMPCERSFDSEYLSHT